MRHLLIISLFFVFGCSEKNIDGFDKEIWKNDKNACKNQRVGLINAFIKQKTVLMGVSQQDIVAFLGRPDKNELYSRGQKFFLYSITPNEFCGTSEKGQTLRIRFNALNSVSEITIDQ